MPRYFAYLLSVVFHPLLIVSYMLTFLLLMNPYLFGVSNITEQFSLIVILMFSTFFMPVLMVGMLKKLDLVQSLELQDRQERIIPYILTGFFYIVMSAFFMYHPDMPNAFTSFVLGTTIALFAAFFVNLFSKISAHAVGMGGLVAMVVISIWQFSHGIISLNISDFATIQINSILLLTFVVLAAGLVGSARLKLEAHVPQDLYGGYLIGFASQFIALRFIF
ncbi:MAG: hypothetical protein AAF847_14720 [Bacteroidota bacterium]